MPEGAVTWTTDLRGIATVTFNRPERNNAYDDAVVDGLHNALDALGSASTLRAVVLTGNGRHFQAGADLSWLESVRAQDRDANIDASRATAEAVNRLNRLPIPTIAAVQGACIGGGTGVISACDIVVAANTATFAISEVRWGLTAAIIVPQLVDAIGVRQLRRYALTGERFGADEARRIGLVHEVVDAEDLTNRVAELIDLLLANGPRAIAETKSHIFDCAAGQLSDDALTELVEKHAAKRQSEEAGEGLASFHDKRPARWSLKPDAVG
ncbi:MAG: enoyl-CoA hydratase-related protein [Pseudomonadota bacterium]